MVSSLIPLSILVSPLPCIRGRRKEISDGSVAKRLYSKSKKSGVTDSETMGHLSSWRLWDMRLGDFVGCFTHIYNLRRLNQYFSCALWWRKTFSNNSSWHVSGGSLASFSCRKLFNSFPFITSFSQQKLSRHLKVLLLARGRRKMEIIYAL